MNYKLHSKAEDNSWFHFRENPDSLMQSFTISYLQDGTIVLSGDMGDLMWKRYDGMQGKKDYGFPNKNTNECYFAEKVILPRKLKVWSSDLAIEILEEYINNGDYFDEEVRKNYEKEKGYGIYIDTQEEFIKLLDEIGIDDCEYYSLGEEWDSWFTYRLEMLKSVSDIILEEVSKDGY